MDVRALDLSHPPTAERVLALQRAAYAVEAALLHDDRIPPLHDDQPTLVASALRWLGAHAGAALVGAVAFTDEGGIVDLHRLVVDPEAHRRGAGRLLVQAVLDGTHAPRVVVSTGRDNLPACRLYASLGFAPAGEHEVLPGLWISRWELLR